jgi:hypothetical protein
MKSINACALVDAQRARDHHAERLAIRGMFKSVSRAGRQEAKRPMLDRLLERVVFGVTECWHWTGPTNGFGYGRMTHQGRLQVAHRLSWETFNGPIQDSLSVLHRCDNPSCINPAHLWLGTYSDNLRDAWAKGRNKGRTGQRKNPQ